VKPGKIQPLTLISHSENELQINCLKNVVSAISALGFIGVF